MVSAVIVAAGKGSRMGIGVKKPYLKLSGKPILAYTLEPFESYQAVEEVVLAVSAEDVKICQKEVVEAYGFRKVRKITSGGESRQESVFKALSLVSSDADIVVIHDGVRPFVKGDLIASCVKAALEAKAATSAVPVKDTVKEVDSKGMVVKTLDRSRLWLSQTPQAFRKDLILEAHRWAKKHDVFGTDDASLVEAFGHKVLTVNGSYGNLKITTAEDLKLAEAIVSFQLSAVSYQLSAFS